MIACNQFRELIIRPSLKSIDLYSSEAEELLIATMATESMGGSFIKQTNGPALGVFQMEPATYHDIWDRYLSKHSILALKIIDLFHFREVPFPEEMIGNLNFSTVMARVLYLQFPEELPGKDDLEGIWTIYKNRWNTSNGETKKFDFFKRYASFTGEKDV